ncbi:putative ribonuclease P protein subunit p14 [Scophthalmus maximus]|uniref:Putative ribonuclease P protein subunit p14 n=1 Tax=Scophthalmus maximus TaxID=52904 RepID=A0A2U9BF49_SCOMX|nr:putative ribonuclease P protein subunit p14 [Scophthalmus maximus]
MRWFVETTCGGRTRGVFFRLCVDDLFLMFFSFQVDRLCRCSSPAGARVTDRFNIMSGVDEKDESAVYRRVVLKNASPYHYLEVCLVLQDESTRLSAVELKQFIISGLKSLYGEVGAALTFDLLKYDEDKLTALLRVYSRGLVKLWSSLTLLGSYQNQACAFRVLQVSPFLLALTGNSRELQLD